MSNVQEHETRQNSVKNGVASGAVCVSSSSSMDPKAGEFHCVALAHHRYPSSSGNRRSFMASMDDSSGDKTNGDGLDFSGCLNVSCYAWKICYQSFVLLGRFDISFNSIWNSV